MIVLRENLLYRKVMMNVTINVNIETDKYVKVKSW